MEPILEWLSDPQQRDYVAAWGFIITLGGTLLTIVGLALTYKQVKHARISTEKVRMEIEAFEFRRRQHDAFADAGEAKTAMESAGKLLRVDSWDGASGTYDEARKAVLRIQLACQYLERPHLRALKVITDHLSDFSNRVDAARAGKGTMPEKDKVLAAIRRHCDSLTTIQVTLQKDVK